MDALLGGGQPALPRRAHGRLPRLEGHGARQELREAKPITVPNGQRLFASKCSACHTIGKGDKLGPDLAGVSARRERAWIARYTAQATSATW